MHICILYALQVWVGDEKCGEVEYEEMRKMYRVLCDGRGKEGTEVTVKKEGEGILTLCEVIVLEVLEEGTEEVDEED